MRLTAKIKQLRMHLSGGGASPSHHRQDESFCQSSYFLTNSVEGTTRIHARSFRDNPVLFQIFYFMVKFLTNKFTWNCLPKEQKPTLVVSRLLKFEQQEVFASGQVI